MRIDHRKIILTRTERGLSLRRIAGFANVVFFWCVMLYLLRSLLLTAWASGKALFFGGAAQFADTSAARLFFTYIGLIVLASSSLWLWARYNRRRYGGNNDKRRVHPEALTLAQLREYTGFSGAKLGQMRRAKVLVAHFDTERELKGMDCYASVKEKEALLAAGFPAFEARTIDIPMREEIQEVEVVVDDKLVG